jgi:oligopeptide transport system substrate-binding protein
VIRELLFIMRNFIFFIVFTVLINSCSSESEKQFEFAGGAISMSIENQPSTFIPRDVSDYYSAVVLTQVMEGLVSMNPKDLTIQPQIASKWEISDDGLTYEFDIRKDIYFHPNKQLSDKSDRLLTVEDVRYSIEMACSKNSSGQAPHAYSFLYKDALLGAKEFFEGKTKEIAGLKIKGTKVKLTLTQKDGNFLNKLANICAAISSSKLKKSTNQQEMIGTGPFMLSNYSHLNSTKMVLLRNPDYYELDDEGNTLPYLDSLIFHFQNRKIDQLEMFENHQTDLILGLPTSRITKMLEGRINDFNSKPPLFVMYNNPLLLTNYYFFDMTDPRFANVKVRQAFNYAINKEKLGHDVLRNQYSEMGIYGIVPPISKIFKGYDFKGVKSCSYEFNPEKARQLLAEAGYPKGKGFGSVNLRFNIDDIHSAVADEFAQQIFQVLNINVNIDGSAFEQTDEDATFCRGDIFRSAWAGDYPSPETFLANFYGKNVPLSKNDPSRINQSRYMNATFDILFEQAKNSAKKTQALSFYSKAEKVLMQDPPFIPLWYSGDIQIVYSNVRNLHFNALNLFVFKKVFKKEWTVEEYKKATN